MTDIEPRFQFTPASQALDREMGGNLVLRGALTSEIVAEIQELDFSRVVLSYGRWSDLTALRGHKIRHLLIRGEAVDWKSICGFKDLISLAIEGDARPELDAELLSRLRFLSAYWDRCLNSALVPTSSLRALELRGPLPSLRSLPSLSGLNALRVIQSPKLLSLDGVEAFGALEYAEFSRCVNLESVGDLRGCEKLECLNFFSCNKLRDFINLSSAPVLRELSLEIGAVDSLAELANSGTIESLRFDCKISDGDLDFIYRMPALKFCLFKNAKNFNRKAEDVQAFLQGKGFDQKRLRAAIRRFPLAGDYHS
jgi:hypothetical protein